MGFKISGGTPPAFTQYVFPDAGTTTTVTPAADGLIQFSKENLTGSLVTSLVPTASQSQYQLKVVQQGDVALTFSIGGTMLRTRAVSWNTIPATLPTGTQNEMLQYLNDPQSMVNSTRAMKGGSVVTGASYSPSTGILAYDTAPITDVYMEADYGTVATVDQLESAISNAGNGDTILIEDGVYTFSSASRVINVANLTIKSVSGNRAACILEGDQIADAAAVQFIFQQTAGNLTIEDLTLRKVGEHLIQMRGVDGLTVRNCVLQDAYAQFIKCSAEAANSNGLIEGCLFEFTVPTPNFYTGGIDCHNPVNWIVRDNIAKNFKSPTSTETEWAFHFWNGGGNVTIERNQIIDCDRGIGFGVSPGQGIDGAVVKNNFITRINDGRLAADHGISVNDSDNILVYNNSVFLADGVQPGIDFRYASTGCECTNNIVNTSINQRDSSAVPELTNIESATSSWFTDVVNGDLHIDTGNATAVAAIQDQGTTLVSVATDYDSNARPYNIGGLWDIGADEIPEGVFNPLQVQSLDAWGWAGASGENVTLTSSGGRQVIATLNDLSGNGNHWTARTLDYPGYQVGISAAGYTTALPCIALDSYSDPFKEHFQQTYTQVSSISGIGEFYLAAAVMNTRTAGRRWLWGNDSTNNVKLEQDLNKVEITIAGSVNFISANSSLPTGAVILEVWRDSSNNVSVWANGSDITVGTPNISGTFAMVGFGGPEFNGSGWDDYAFELQVYNALPTAAERLNIRTYLNDRWMMY